MTDPIAQNAHPLVEALRPGGPQVEPEPRTGARTGLRNESRKMLVCIADGAYVDPLGVVCVRAVAVGTQGHVRVTLENGDDFDVLHHDCEFDQPDAGMAERVIKRLQEGFQAAW